MYPKKIIKKVPGDILPLSKKESQGYIDDLSRKQKFELEELLGRQNKLLVNKQFISKLPDKGEKIIAFRERILKELDHRNEVEKAATLLSKLNIASEGKVAMNELEWTGKYSETQDATKIVELDSDDEDNPLKILAQPTGTGVHKKKVIELPPEENLITLEDLAEIESCKIQESLEEHVKYIVEKVEKPEGNVKKKGQFKPYKTTKSNVHDPEKEKERKQNKNWEPTAATPPLIVHGAAKVLSLNESLKLQKDQSEKLQEIQTKHAANRLAEQFGLHNAGTIPASVGNYRLKQDAHDTSSSSSSENEEEHEVYDNDDNDKAGTVVYTVDSVES